MTDDDDDPLYDVEIETFECDAEGCGETFLTPRQLRAHQSKHSNYFERLRDDDEDT